MADSGKFALTTYLNVAAGLKAYAVGFPFLNMAHVTAKIDGVVEADWTISGSTLTFGATVTIVGGEKVEILRTSPSTFATLQFQASNVSVLGAEDLNSLAKSLLYLTQELSDNAKRVGPVTRFKLSGSFTVPSGTPAFTAASTKMTPVLAEEISDDSNAITVSGSDVVLAAGKYRIDVACQLNNSGAGTPNVEILLANADGSSGLAGNDAYKMAGTTDGTVVFSYLYEITATSSVSLRARADLANATVTNPHVMTIQKLD